MPYEKIQILVNELNDVILEDKVFKRHFIFYEGNINVKDYIISTILVLILCLIIKTIYTIIKKIK